MTTTLSPLPGTDIDPAHLADALRRWFAGTPAAAAGVVLLEPGDDVPADLRPGTVVLHADGEPAGTAVPHVAYEGVLDYGGGEITVGDDLIVQLEGYSTAQYVSVACPTVVSVVDDVDREILVADARAAHETGAFPHHLVHPLVVVRDELAWLGAGAGLAGPDAALVDGPDGPAVRRFLGAVRLLRAIRRRTTGTLTVDGFGASPGAASSPRGAAAVRRDAVFVVRDGVGAYVADAVAGTVARVPDDVAAAVQGTLDGTPLDAALLDRLGGAGGIVTLFATLGLPADALLGVGDE